MIIEIRTQEWVADSFHFSYGANQGWRQVPYIADFMQQLAFYYYQKGDIDQGKKYLESVLLLYSKLSKHNSDIVTSFSL